MSDDINRFLSQHLAANTDLSWRPHGGLARIGIGTFPRSSSVQDITDIAGGESVTIIPVISWPTTESPLRVEMKTSVLSAVEKLASMGVKQGAEIDVSRDVVKVNFTGRSSPTGRGFDGKTGFFAGQITPGHKYIIADDRIDSGNTFRDLQRYIESSGGIVIGLIETGTQYQKMSFSLYPKENIDKLFAVLWQASKGGGSLLDDAVKDFAALPEVEREKIKITTYQASKSFMAPTGLDLNQLTSGEVSRIYETFLEYARDGFTSKVKAGEAKLMEQLWQGITNGWKEKKWPSIDSIKNPEGLLNIRQTVSNELMRDQIKDISLPNMEPMPQKDLGNRSPGSQGKSSSSTGAGTPGGGPG